MMFLLISPASYYLHLEYLLMKFQAFRLAKEHLHIRPLLDVEDMLCDKSDKRSVITYVSQFIRTLKHLRPITTCPMIDDRALISWMENTLNTLGSSVNEPLYDQYQVVAEIHFWVNTLKYELSVQRFTILVY